jgi:hypothetical protein
MIMDKFTSEEQVEILEIARVALADAGIADAIGDALDLSDEYLIQLREKIHENTEGVDIDF